MQLKIQDLKKALEIKRFLEENYLENHDYNSISHRFGINTFKLKQAFKRVANDSIHSFIINTRIERAKELLENTDDTIEYIATRINLYKSNLYIQFKKRTGKTPAQWRNTNYITKVTGVYPHPGKM